MVYHLDLSMFLEELCCCANCSFFSTPGRHKRWLFEGIGSTGWERGAELGIESITVAGLGLKIIIYNGLV